MKNIHVLPTDRPSRLYKFEDKLIKNDLIGLYDIEEKEYIAQHIYITSDEEIKEGDWVITNNGLLAKVVTELTWHFINSKKIILTTDQDLIKDGVQGIDDEFLEWFVKNPSCQYGGYKDIDWDKIIIPKEELTISDEAKQRAKNYMSLKGALKPKQETLEEAMRRNGYHDEVNDTLWREGVLFGAKWQAERMYSEEEVHKILCKSHNAESTSIIANTLKKWLEQFKKK